MVSVIIEGVKAVVVREVRLVVIVAMDRKVRRAVCVVAFGICFTVIGSSFMSYKEHLEALTHFHHLGFETLGGFFHAAGFIPILHYIEPAWKYLLK